MKNKFYQLHIPKTGGLFLNSFFSKNLKPTLEECNIETLIDLHHGWKPVSDNTYIFTSFRDPVKRVVSHFCWLLLTRYAVFGPKTLNNRHQYYFSVNIRDIFNPTVSEFMKWLDINNNILSNFQLKNMFYDKEDFIKYKYFEVLSPYSLNNFSISEALSNFSKIDVVIKTEQVNMNTMMHITLNKILKDFNIDKDIDFINIDYKNATYVKDVEVFSTYDQQYNSNNMSQILYNKLSKNDIAYIESLNIEEMNIYNTDSYFYNNGKNISPSN